jgi:DNA-binding response OmpR family regulator
MSGYAGDALGEENGLPADVNFIQKPFSPRALARRVREILDRAQSML